MIISRKKPLDEILSELLGIRKIAVIGCKNCAAVCAVGGETECAEMKAALESAGIEVTAVTMTDESCVHPYAKKAVREATRTGAEAILSLACGSGVQTIAQNAQIPVYTGSNTLFIGQIERPGIFHEMCRSCGSCVLNQTGGICPVTKCAKSLVNGPCGGAKNGKCEVNPENDCAWIMIYNKLAALNQLDKLGNSLADKDYDGKSWPRTVDLKKEGLI